MQLGSVPPGGQLLPGAVVDRWLVMTAVPDAGGSTVDDPLTVTVAPTGMSPVQTRSVSVTDKVPDETVSSPLGTEFASMLASGALIEMPKYGVWPVLVKVEVKRITPP